MTTPGPLRFRPFLRPMVWGGRRLGEAVGKDLPTDELYGESWEVSDHSAHASVVEAGPWAGRTLRQLMQTERQALLGGAAERHSDFPWLIKFLDAADWLSVQVHPDDEAAPRLLPGERGKTEAWFILDAAPGSRVYAGLKPGVGEKTLRSAVDDGTVADCLHSFEPQPGDCVFLPAGTVHAVGGGVLMAEVQQTSDATFRLFDWNRRDARGQGRKLHVEEAVACIDWQQGPVAPLHVPDFAAGIRRRLPLVHTRHFVLEYVEETGPFAWGGPRPLQALIVVHGRGHLQTAEGVEPLECGQTLVLPAETSEVRCVPDPSLAVLLCTLPDAG